MDKVATAEFSLVLMLHTASSMVCCVDGRSMTHCGATVTHASSRGRELPWCFKDWQRWENVSVVLMWPALPVWSELSLVIRWLVPSLIVSSPALLEQLTPALDEELSLLSSLALAQHADALVRLPSNPCSYGLTCDLAIVSISGGTRKWRQGEAEQCTINNHW